jgi:hypothetical protein
MATGREDIMDNKHIAADTDTAFSKLDRVARNQRRMMGWNALTTALFVSCTVIVAGSLGGCGHGEPLDDEAAFERNAVARIVQALDAGDVAAAQTHVATDLREELQASHEALQASFEHLRYTLMASTYVNGAWASRIAISGTLRQVALGFDAADVGRSVSIELEVFVSEDEQGRVSGWRRGGIARARGHESFPGRLRLH